MLRFIQGVQTFFYYSFNSKASKKRLFSVSNTIYMDRTAMDTLWHWHIIIYRQFITARSGHYDVIRRESTVWLIFH